MPLPAIQDMLVKNHQVNVSIQKVFRAKRIATTRIIGDYREQYGILRSCCEALLRENPGSTIKMDTEPCANPRLPTRQFKRCYACFASIMRGFKMCGREILGPDGCFMKAPFPGQILTAVGVDGNNGIYPVAYALVEAKTFKSWEWFLELLKDDLGLANSTNFTFISDRQKGLLPALSEVFPGSEHRFCLRHIHQNLKKYWPGDVYKNLLWGVACKTSMPYFEKSMEEMKIAEPGFHEKLSHIPASSWSKAHFSGRAKCDILFNNICEVFNRQLIGARDKPVITYLEFIRVYMTIRIVNVKKIQAKAHGPLTPHAQEVFNKIKEEASQLNVLMVGAVQYQVNSLRSQCVVNMKNRTCTCRKWDLTSMPCKHVVAAINDMARNDIRIGVPKELVEVYWLSTWKKVYENVINPIPGPENWIPSQCPTTLLPPKHHKQVGRPQKKRKKSVGEVEVEAYFDSEGKMTRKGNTTKCSKCGNLGHNSRTCKEQGGENVVHAPSEDQVAGGENKTRKVYAALGNAVQLQFMFLTAVYVYVYGYAVYVYAVK
ncbi:uncharacterized protein LOC110933562 [Helianthus annuus]|uniref:uncharacterized protein LOC110933562 n=1 Tax=Helianthus annuus TaxID=4232 RepID=UPI000B8FD7E1|nr:uncharacterized protein LOC110933562 [Helianthus annuus]